MSLNFNKDGKRVAVVNGGKYNKKMVYISSEADSGDEDSDNDNKISKTFTSIKLNRDGKFQQTPDNHTEREIIYITGPSGSGKSTYTKNYIQQYKKLYPKNKIYIFSALDSDESIDELGGNRVIIDDTLITDPIDIDEFKDSVVVFDDIDVISNKKVRDAVYSLLNQVLEIGRHHKISCCITNHLPTAGKDTRRILNEAHSVIYFPHSGSMKSLNYLLTDYLGLDKTDIKKIKHSKSRWCCVFKNYPQVIMTERNMYLLSNDDD